MNKVVIENIAKELSVEDAGYVRIIQIEDSNNEDSCLFIRLQSNDEECIHDELMQFYNKKVRITIEAIDEIISKNDMIEDLNTAVKEYYNWINESFKTSGMLLSNPIDPRPAEIMWSLEKARVNMFEIAGIDVTEEKELLSKIENAV